MATEVYTLATLEAYQPEGDLYAVIGSPIAHSLSPILQKPAFDHYGMKAEYLRVHVEADELPAAITLFKKKGLKGFNITLPYKIRVMEHLEEIDAGARTLGAVNTATLREGKLAGYNTDGPGWVRALRDVFSVDVRDLRVMVLGLGGAGEALATQAALEGCERLVLVNRNTEKTQMLAEKLKPYFRSEKLMGARDRLMALPWDEDRIAKEVDGIDLIVHCTPVGLNASDPSPVPARVLQPHLLVYDTIYSPPVTSLMRAARAVGARAANGLSMLLHQGALSFEIWTGREAPIQKMKEALEAYAQHLKNSLKGDFQREENDK